MKMTIVILDINFAQKDLHMREVSTKDTTLLLKIDTFDLNPAQIRLLKHIHTLLIHVIAAEDEAEYFETSAELIKQTASLIQNTNFTDKQQLTQQALEYAIDFLQERMNDSHDVQFDN